MYGPQNSNPLIKKKKKSLIYPLTLGHFRVFLSLMIRLWHDLDRAPLYLPLLRYFITILFIFLDFMSSIHFTFIR